MSKFSQNDSPNGSRVGVRKNSNFKKSKLKGLRDSRRGIDNKRRYQGLIAVLEHLLLPSEYLSSDVAQLVDPDSRDLFSFGNMKDFAEFDKAMNIYFDEIGLLTEICLDLIIKRYVSEMLCLMLSMD